MNRRNSQNGSANVRIRLAGVNQVRKRLADGSTRLYYYHRITGKRLPDNPQDPEFLVALAAANKVRSNRLDGTVAGLVKSYEDSPDFARLAESTRSVSKYIFRVIDREYGDLPLEALEDRAAVRSDMLKWRDRISVQSPRGADNTLSHLARVLSWAKDRGLVRENPLEGFRRVYRSDRSELIWLPDHVAAFQRIAPLPLKNALMLALHTGQRQGDLLALSWTAYDGKALHIRQGKTGVRVIVPCTAALKALLDALPRKQAVILTSPSGQAWKADHFRHVWRDYSNRAGLKDLNFHDLRGTAVTMLSEAGCTPQEIAAITGHSLRNVTTILERYLAMTRTLAENAIAKLEAYRGLQSDRK
jgi:integrase